VNVPAMGDRAAVERSCGESGTGQGNLIGVDASQLDTVSAILSQAFEDDPVLRWINRQEEFVPSFFRMILPYFIEKGLTYTDDQRRGAASWVGPGDHVRWPYSLANVVEMTRLCGFRGVYRLAVSGSRTGHYRPREPHYYLFAIGAKPECQGQGVGSLLISHILRRCDREQVPAYLENSRRANLDFYRGHGFEIQQQIQFTDESPPLWLMWREPRKPG
jgi:ribosomal protein S18 acetylase RimI-like enzyme